MQNFRTRLRDADSCIQWPANEDVVLIIGDTGVGKSTLTAFIANNDNHLILQETYEDSGEFIINDEYDKISHIGSTIESKTLLPDPVICNEQDNTIYYDCPGFNDTRGLSINLLSAYTIKKLMCLTKRMKIILVIDYYSVKIGGHRHAFRNLMKHVTRFIKDIDKYHDSIGLVVTKVDNKSFSTPVHEKNVVLQIITFLTYAEKCIKDSMENTSEEKMVFLEKTLKLIETLLTTDEENYTRITIFRCPDRNGDLNEIDFLNNDKLMIKQMLQQGLNCTSCNHEDFTFTISEEIQIDIIKEYDKVTEDIDNNINGIADNLRVGFLNKEKELNDMMAYHLLLQRECEHLRDFIKTQRDIKDPVVFVEKLRNAVHSNISSSENDSLIFNIRDQNEDLEKLSLVCFKPLTIKSDYWIKVVEKLSNYLNTLEHWFKILLLINEKLSSYDVQKLIHRATDPIVSTFVAGDIGKNDLIELLEILEIEEHDFIQKTELDEIVMKNIVNMFKFSVIKNMITNINKNTKTLRVSSNYIMLSEVINIFEQSKTKVKKPKTKEPNRTEQSKSMIESIEIFAAYKIFIDADFVQKIKNLVIFAPIWEIVGDERDIDLSGRCGKRCYLPKAADGYSGITRETNDDGEQGGRGAHGRMGSPGGDAGNFFGVGYCFKNGENLLISADGGTGGRGQSGGDGGRGFEGKISSTVIPSNIETKVENWSYKPIIYITSYTNFEIMGSCGGWGGNGGNGGPGGLGGHPDMLR